MKTNSLMPCLRNSFSVNLDKENIIAKLNKAKEKIGLGHIEENSFNFTRYSNQSNRFFVTGRFERIDNGHQISYEIKLFKILVYLFYIGIPITYVSFFVSEPLSEPLRLTEAPMWIRFIGHIVGTTLMTLFLYWIILLDMKWADRTIKKQFIEHIVNA